MITKLKELAIKSSRAKLTEESELTDLDSLALVSFCVLVEHWSGTEVDANKVVQMKTFSEVENYLISAGS